MTTPLWDGAPLFGHSVRCLIQPRPRPVSDTSYFGLDGATGFDGGARGTEIQVAGELRAPSRSLLAAAQDQLRYTADGRAHTFTDTSGRSWPQTVSDGFAPAGKVTEPPGSGYVAQGYALKFTSLKGAP